VALFGQKPTRAERNKIEPALQLWLDGRGKPEDFGLASPSTGKGRGARVSVEFVSAPQSKDVKRYAALGIEVEPGETVAFGAVTRDNLASLARDVNVSYVQPSLPKAPSSLKGPR
jgi:hypothetical protein